MKKIIFIGDSITEHGRFQDEEGIGSGYVRLIHDYLHINQPEKNLQIVNKGISGDEVTHLHARWNKDVIKEQPDYLSISVGINDAWGQIKQGHFDETKLQDFTHLYEEMLSDLQAKTNAKIILMEPTIITENKHEKGNRYLEAYVKEVRKLHEKFPSILVPLFDSFRSYDKNYPEHKLTNDGIHMTTKGSTLMAVTWLQTVKNANIIN